MGFYLSVKWITRKVEMIQCRKKDKPFNCNMDPEKNLFMKLKQFRTNENSLDYRLQTVIRKEVQAKKSVR